MRAPLGGKGHLSVAAPAPDPDELITSANLAIKAGNTPRAAALLRHAVEAAVRAGEADVLLAAMTQYARVTPDAHQDRKGRLEAEERLTAAQAAAARARKERDTAGARIAQLEKERDTAIARIAQLVRERDTAGARIAQLENAAAGKAAGRRAGRPLARVPGDIAEHDLRPDPGAARSPAELMTALREFREWAGNPSFRDMAERSGRAASTLCTALKSDEMPGQLWMINAVIEGCGGDDADHRRFASAWRRLRMARRVTAEVGPADKDGPPDRPQRTLSPVPPPKPSADGIRSA